VYCRELVTAGVGGTRSLEGSLRQRTIAPTLSDGGFHFGQLKNRVSERQGASRRGRNLSESGFLSFCVMLSLSAEHPSCLLSKGVNLMLDRPTITIFIIGKLQFSMQANSVAKSQID
jgi:hypothetical protein